MAALTREDLTTDFVAALTGEGPFTVFAPTNDAFAALLNELGAASLNDVDAATLEAVLKMHVIEGNVMSSDLTEGLTAPTLLGEDLMFSLENGAKIMDPNGRVSNIIDIDYEAQNGVVHVIDTVILPDQTTTSISELSKLNIKLYPNPASDYVVIETEIGTHDIKITDISGKTKLNRITDNSIININLQDFTPGVYFITIKSESVLSVQKLIVR